MKEEEVDVLAFYYVLPNCYLIDFYDCRFSIDGFDQQSGF